MLISSHRGPALRNQPRNFNIGLSPGQHRYRQQIAVLSHNGQRTPYPTFYHDVAHNTVLCCISHSSLCIFSNSKWRWGVCYVRGSFIEFKPPSLYGIGVQIQLISSSLSSRQYLDTVSNTCYCGTSATPRSSPSPVIEYDVTLVQVCLY